MAYRDGRTDDYAAHFENYADRSDAGTDRNDSEAGTAQAPWDALGRGSAAGRMLFALYNKDVTGRGTGNAYSQTNKNRLDRALARGYEPKPVAPPPKPVVERPTVAVPKLRGLKSTAEIDSDRDVRHEQSGRGRKTLAQIAGELQALDVEIMNDSRLQRPRGPTLGDKEKARLARYMEWGGKPPESWPRPPAPLKPPANSPPPRAPTRLDLLERRWVELEAEVDERKAFLEEMRAIGQSAKYESQLEGEIAGKFRALRDLDAKIRAAVQEESQGPKPVD